MEGYQKPYTDLGTDYHYLDDASGYVSRYDNLAHKLPPDKLCERCFRQACWAPRTLVNKDGEYDWTGPHHLLCLRCRDDWSDFVEEPEHRINNRMSNWEVLFREFLRSKPNEIST